MIGTEDELLRRELRESALDIVPVKARAIAADRDHFVVTELGNRLDRVLKARRKIPACLSMHTPTGNSDITSRREKMDIGRRRNFRPKRGKIQERPRRHRERAPRQIDMRFLGEEENGASGHAFGYEKAREETSLFRKTCKRLQSQRLALLLIQIVFSRNSDLKFCGGVGMSGRPSGVKSMRFQYGQTVST